MDGSKLTVFHSFQPIILIYIRYNLVVFIEDVFHINCLIPGKKDINAETLQSVRKNDPCDVIKGRDERRGGKGNPLKKDGSIDVPRLIFSDTL